MSGGAERPSSTWLKTSRRSHLPIWAQDHGWGPRHRRTQPSAQVTAADFAVEMLRAGKHKVDATPEMAARTHVVGADAHHLPFHDDSFDRAFSTFCVRNLTDIPQAMGELHRVVGSRVWLSSFSPGKKGRFAAQVLDGFYNRRLLPIIGRALTGDTAAYNYHQTPSPVSFRCMNTAPPSSRGLRKR